MTYNPDDEQIDAMKREQIAEIERMNKKYGGIHTCGGDHCEGHGLTRDLQDVCAYCDDIEAQIWAAGEPD